MTSWEKTQASKPRMEVKLIGQYTKRNLLQKVPYDVHSILMAGDASSEYKKLQNKFLLYKYKVKSNLKRNDYSVGTCIFNLSMFMLQLVVSSN